MTEEKDFLEEKKPLPKGFLAQNKKDPAGNRARRKRLEEGGLTMMQDRFCEEYMKDFKILQSFVRAGYAEKSAHVNAYKTFNLPNVQKKIHTLLEERKSKSDVSIQGVIAAIHQMAEECWANGKHRDALRAYELLGKHLGAFIDKQESKITIDSADEAEVDRRIEALIEASTKKEDASWKTDETVH